MGSLNVAGLRVRRQRVTTYSGLVKVLRKRIASYVTEGIERVRALREAVRLTDEPVEVKGRIWRTPFRPTSVVISDIPEAASMGVS
jgi:hypothetical protein